MPRDITSKVDKQARENARIDRDRQNNPAETEPGMDDFDWDGFNDSEGGGDSMNDSGWGSSDNWGDSASGSGGGGFGDSGGFGNNGGGFGGFGDSGFGSPPKQDTSAEDKFFEGVKKVGLGFFTFFSAFIDSFKTFDLGVRLRSSKAVLITGGITSVVGLILILLGFGSQLGFACLVGGLISAGVGVTVFMFSYDDYINQGKPELASRTTEEVDDENIDFSGEDEDDDGMFGFDDEEDDSFGDDSDGFGFDDEDSDPLEDEFAFDDFGDFGEEPEPEVAPINLEQNMETILDNVQEGNAMVTRQYLYENITNCLMNVNRNFDQERWLPENSDEFDAWDAIVQSSADVFKPKGDDVELPYLISAKEKLFYVQLEIKRVKWLKNIDNLVNEIVNIYRFDEEKGLIDESVYGVGHTVGDKVYIKIMTGETSMVTVKDTYKNIQSDILDSSNKMPVVLGVDEEGNVVWRDFGNINSILVTGMPRSGKTWLVQSVIAQMMFYLKPSELNFYIFDPKGNISDFKPMQMPHIRKFISDKDKMVAELKHIVKVEGARRSKIIGDAGFVNIVDYKKKNPDVDLPLLYVVIDEVITLAEDMSKETKDEFQSLLLELVSKLPALGIRIFMIPHIVKDNILKKSITDLIPCRISVCGDEEHIEKSVGAKNFKHKLFHKGDTAVRFNNDKAMFVRSAVLTDSNELSKDLFDFLLKFWSKLEPESVEGSLYNKNLQKISGVNNPKRESLITIETNEEENYENVRQTSKLNDNDMQELLKMAEEDSLEDEWK